MMKELIQRGGEVKPNQPTVKIERAGWFKVWRADRDRIINQCEGAAPAVLSVWDAFCDLANEHGSNTITETIGIIRTRAGVSRATAFRCVGMLEELGMISHESNADPKNKKRLLASTFKLLTPSHNETTPSLSKPHERCDRGFKKLRRAATKAAPKKRREEGASGELDHSTGNHPPANALEAQAGSDYPDFVEHWGGVR